MCGKGERGNSGQHDDWPERNGPIPRQMVVKPLGMSHYQLESAAALKSKCNYSPECASVLVFITAAANYLNQKLVFYNTKEPEQNRQKFKAFHAEQNGEK